MFSARTILYSRGLNPSPVYRFLKIFTSQMAPKELNVTGFVELDKKLGELDNSPDPVFVLFSGSKDAQGKSWCPDCVKAEPVIEECAKSLDDTAVIIHCDVGPRDYWKDKNNSFRTDARFKITGVPTLIKWKSKKRLVENELFDKNLVSMIFED